MKCKTESDSIRHSLVDFKGPNPHTHIWNGFFPKAKETSVKGQRAQHSYDWSKQIFHCAIGNRFLKKSINFTVAQPNPEATIIYLFEHKKTKKINNRRIVKTVIQRVAVCV